MSDIKKLGKIEGHVSAVFNAHEVAFIGTHLNKTCDTVNQLIDEFTKLKTELNELKTDEPDKELKEKVETYKNAYRIMSNAFENEVTKNTRPQGEWIDHSEEGYVECPFCKHLTNCEDNIDELHYCWNCGAYMRKGGSNG